METILGIKGPDFVMLAADCTQAHSIIMMKEGNAYSNNTKSIKISNLKLVNDSAQKQ